MFSALFVFLLKAVLGCHCPDLDPKGFLLFWDVSSQNLYFFLLVRKLKVCVFPFPLFSHGLDLFRYEAFIMSEKPSV